ncbi:MAG: hypothetical protein DDT22_00316 [candidate division WS2 bacterium]|nr:hypothetical protein [Candidatus Lithacetigena glycinireducens]
MFSMPPAMITFPSPDLIDCAAEMIDCKPEPQTRFIVIAGIVTGSPLFNTT